MINWYTQRLIDTNRCMFTVHFKKVSVTLHCQGQFFSTSTVPKSWTKYAAKFSIHLSHIKDTDGQIITTTYPSELFKIVLIFSLIKHEHCILLQPNAVLNKWPKKLLFGNNKGNVTQKNEIHVIVDNVLLTFCKKTFFDIL